MGQMARRILLHSPSLRRVNEVVRCPRFQGWREGFATDHGPLRTLPPRGPICWYCPDRGAFDPGGSPVVRFAIVWLLYDGSLDDFAKVGDDCACCYGSPPGRLPNRPAARRAGCSDLALRTSRLGSSSALSARSTPARAVFCCLRAEVSRTGSRYNPPPVGSPYPPASSPLTGAWMSVTVSVAWLYSREGTGWMRARDFSFEAGLFVAKFPEEMRSILKRWIAAFSEDGFAEDVSCTGVEAWAVRHDAGVQQQDALVERLRRILSELTSL